jgi:ankyrin repeat protein
MQGVAKISAGFRNTELHRVVANAIVTDETTELKALLQHISDPNIEDSTGQTALHHACNSGHLQVAKLLLSLNGISLEVRDYIKWTPLHFAALNGNEKLIQLLLDSNADARAVDIRGQTPLHIAEARGNIAAMTLLLKAGSSMTAETGMDTHRKIF